MKTALISFGEVLWDVIGEETFIGGAPFNLASHFAAFEQGCAYLISSVGDDALGAKALESVASKGVRLDYLKRNNQPTGKVLVAVGEEGEPTYTICENVAWDDIALDAGELSRLKKLESTIFSFGTLAQRSEVNRATLSKLLAEVEFDDVFYDINLRQDYFEASWIERSLEACSIVKLNEEEVRVIAQLIAKKPFSRFEQFCEWLSSAFSISTIVITLGGEGAVAYKDGEFVLAEPEPVSVADAVGAGDSLSAAFLFARSRGLSLAESLKLGTTLAGFVVTQSGAVPPWDALLTAQIEQILTNAAHYGAD